MKGLTAKEEEIMGFFWEKGPMFVKQLVELYEEPRPHFNTLSTIVRGLEEKGYLSHTAFGWTVRPQDETQVIRKGELIEVVKISGVKLIVKRVKEA